MRSRLYKLHLFSKDLVDCHNLLGHNAALERRIEDIEFEAECMLVEMKEELEMEKGKVAVAQDELDNEKVKVADAQGENRLLHESEYPSDLTSK